jgi:hypothetical protein
MIKVNWIFFLIGMASCSPAYFPTPDATPMFTGKKQGQLSGGVSTGGYFGQASYAFSDSWAGSINVVHLRDKQQGDFTNHNMFESSFGYYRNFNDQWCFELWSGMGFGKTSSQFIELDWCFWFPCLDDDPYSVSAKFNDFFIQSTIGMNKNRFQWAFSSKLNYIQFNSLHVKYGTESLEQGRQAHLAFEPSMMIRASLWRKRLFWTCQLGYSTHLSNPKFDWVPFKVSNGLVFRFERERNK